MAIGSMAKQMRRLGNRETVLLPARFILQFYFFCSVSLSLLSSLLRDRQSFVLYWLDYRNTRIFLICR